MLADRTTQNVFSLCGSRFFFPSFTGPLFQNPRDVLFFKKLASRHRSCLFFFPTGFSFCAVLFSEFPFSKPSIPKDCACAPPPPGRSLWASVEYLFFVQAFFPLPTRIVYSPPLTIKRWRFWPLLPLGILLKLLLRCFLLIPGWRGRSFRKALLSPPSIPPLCFFPQKNVN